MFCYGYLLKLRGPAWAVANYSISQPAGGNSQNSICETLQLTGWKTLYKNAVMPFNDRGQRSFKNLNFCQLLLVTKSGTGRSRQVRALARVAVVCRKLPFLLKQPFFWKNVFLPKEGVSAIRISFCRHTHTHTHTHRHTDTHTQTERTFQTESHSAHISAKIICRQFRLSLIIWNFF